MSKKWNFMKSESVYVYPSANADDGGDVNSEFNIKGIPNHLTQKNFIISTKDSEVPFNVVKISDTEFNIYQGSGIIDGYYINLLGFTGPENKCIASGEEITPKYIDNLQDFLTTYPGIYYKHYDKSGNKLNHSINDNTIPELPLIHVIIKTLNNTTGNIRGDLLEINNSGNRELTCKGVAWSLVTTQELNSLKVPYLDIASIIISPDSTFNHVIIKEIIINPNRYSYLDINSVYDKESGLTLKQYFDKLIEFNINNTKSLIYYDKTPEEYSYKYCELLINQGGVTLQYYRPTKPYSFDAKGYLLVEPVPIQDIIDQVGTTGLIALAYLPTNLGSMNFRTYGTSTPNKIESFILSPYASKIDPNDSNTGIYNNVGTIGSTSHTNNGKSVLLARADHDHDARYARLGTEEDTSSSEGNEIYVPTIIHSLASSSFAIYDDKFNDTLLIVDSNEDPNVIHLGKLGKIDYNTHQVSLENVDITTKGTITGSKVYNAVWNDYADALKREEESKVEYGDVVCKVPNKSTYSVSSYETRKLVVGVCSDTYGHLLGGDPNKSMEENLKEYIPVAVAGNVKVKVVLGSVINEGDLLTVSGVPGRATACSHNIELGTIIGKALESTDGTKDKILMQVSLM